jgi:site-specific DNA recombinase
MSESERTPAVIYAAKSTEDTHGSIPDQFADGHKLAVVHGFAVVAERHDEAKSAYHGDRGPGLADAMAECERLSAEHGSCALIVQRSDRLARGDGKQARSLVEIVLWAIKHDVELHSVMDPEILAGGDMALLMSAVGAMKGHGESKVKSESVKKGMSRQAAKGRFVGGRVPFGYRGVGKGGDRRLEEVPAQAQVVRSIFADYVAGVSARELTRSLNADGTPGPSGRLWQRSAVVRVLGNITYLGKVRAGDELLSGHPAIVDEVLWQRAQAIRAGNLKRKPGRHPDGGHLLVKGLLRCHCGAAMKPMRERHGVSRSAYRCAGRIEHGAEFCAQPGIPREFVDEPLLRHLLDRYVDLEAMRRRIADRIDSGLVNARRLVAVREAEAATLERALTATERAWDAGEIDARQYAKRESRLTDELDGARAALEQAQRAAESASRGLMGGDPEQELLDHLAALKAAVANGIERAPNLNALRNVLSELFESIALVAPDLDGGPGFEAWTRALDGEGFVPFKDAAVAVDSADRQRYWLLPHFRWSAVDRERFEPMPVELPGPALLVAKP